MRPLETTRLGMESKGTGMVTTGKGDHAPTMVTGGACNHRYGREGGGFGGSYAGRPRQTRDGDMEGRNKASALRPLAKQGEKANAGFVGGNQRSSGRKEKELKPASAELASRTDILSPEANSGNGFSTE